MAKMLPAAAAWLATQIQAAGGATYLYKRGSQTCSLAANPGSALLRVDDGHGGTRIYHTDSDFVFEAAELILGGQVVRPEEGDQIIETVAGGGERTYEAMPPAPNEQCWRWADAPTKLMIRLHTKLVDE